MEFQPETTKVMVLRGEEIHCIGALPPGLLFDFAELQSDDNPMRVAAAIGRFLKALVIPEDQERYRRLLYDTENILDYNELTEAAGELLRSYTARPTERPSESPDGSPPTGELTRHVSFSRGTVEVAPASSLDGLSPES
jgi:hypothetical protein